MLVCPCVCPSAPVPALVIGHACGASTRDPALRSGIGIDAAADMRMRGLGEADFARRRRVRRGARARGDAQCRVGGCDRGEDVWASTVAAPVCGGGRGDPGWAAADAHQTRPERTRLCVDDDGARGQMCVRWVS